jgi:signal transduction histidine kinase
VAARAAVLTLLLVMGTACASALIGRAIAKPIESLTHAASRIAHGERQAVLPPPFGREVRTLTAAVESMRRELEGRHLAERLAVDLSHELKNPVAAIRASAEVLADGALEEPETARRFIGRILEATQRVLALCNNLLMLTRLQARGVVAEPVDVGDLVQRSVDAHAAQAQKRGVRLRIEQSGAAMVHGDSVWLRRALDNLVDNALAFSVSLPAAAGELPPRLEVQVLLRLTDKQVRVEVCNHGRGIAPEIRDRLFERFVTTRRDDGGSGLGLAIVAAVAEQHGGSVEVLAYGPPETRLALVLPRAPSPLHPIFP